jgi:predicted acyl esterase
MNGSDEGSKLSRRSILRGAAVGTAGLSLVGSASADHVVPDEPLPLPSINLQGFDCDPDAEEFYSEVSRDSTHEFGEEQTIELDSNQDGEKIQLGVLWPDLEDSETAPVILRATPYISDLRESSVRDCIRTRRLAENYVEQGYAVAAVAVRGTGGSGGCMELMGANEQADVNQAVTWLGEHGRSNGNVAIIGRSYDGSTPWMAARLGNPHLATVVPFCGVPDVHGLMYKRGAAEQRGFGVFPNLYYLISLADHNPTTGTGLATYLSRLQCPGNYVEGTLWSIYSAVTGERDPEGYWTERVLKLGVAGSYDGSILMVHGLQDWNVNPSQVFPWTKALRAAGIKTHIYFNQMSHRYPDDGRIRGSAAFNPDWADFLLAWFESELKNRPEAEARQVLPEEPEGDVVDPFEARVHAQSSDGEWYTADEWPPAEATPKALYMGTDGDLRSDPADNTGTAVVNVDPADTTTPDCRSCVTFETEPFETEFRFAGVADLEVTVTPTGPDGHLSAFLYAVDDETTEKLGWGQVDLRFAQDRPEGATVVPGEPIDVQLPFEPVDATVAAGQRLVLVLHQETDPDREYSPTPAPVEVQFGGDNRVVLDCWGGDAAGFSPVAAGARDTDASAYPAGATGRQTVTVTAPETGTVVDSVPATWTVLADASEDVARVETDGDRKRVVFADPVAAGDRTTYQYRLEAPDGVESVERYEFGPLEVESGVEQVAVDGTRRTAFVSDDE